MEQTERLRLPLLSAGQLQKELWHGEGLLLIDSVVCGRMTAQPLTEPPSAPTPLIWYRIGTPAAGEWASHDGELAVLTAGGWRFLAPFEGLALLDVTRGSRWCFRDGAWEDGISDVTEIRVGGTKVISGQEGAISDPTGGAVIDTEARGSVAAILAAMRNHGLIAEE